MINIIKKQDLSIVPRWTDNIKDEWINPFITQSCELDFYDTLSQTLYNAIANLVVDILAGAQGNAWVDKVYAVEDIVTYNGVYYIVNSPVIIGESPPPANNKYTVSELLNFWANFVKPFLVYSSYKRFLLWHGKHISMGGVRKHNDNTSFEVNADELTYLLSDLRSIVSVKQTKMYAELKRVDYTFDSVKYVTNLNVSKPNKGLNIFAV
jgi:hypothetical protein